MKYILFSLLVLSVLGCVSLSGSSSALDGDGFGVGEGTGYRGPIIVQVRIAAGNIVEIEILDSVEDRFVGSEAIEELLEMVIMYNSIDLDVISGATYSSRGFLEAVENAIMQL